MILDRLRSRTNERPLTFRGTFLARYMFASRFVKSKKVLDLGTGLGDGAYYLSQKGARYVLGIDYSTSAINEAKKRFISANLGFETMNALDISSLNKSFDVITAFEIIEHLPTNSHSLFLDQIKKSLAPGGVCFISTPNKLVSSPNQKTPKNPYHQKEFTPRELFQLSKKYFPKTTLIGIKCVNQNYLRKNKLIQKRIGNKAAIFLSRFKIITKLLPLIPKRLKQIITSENLLPPLKTADFKFLKKKIKDCENLFIICKNLP